MKPFVLFLCSAMLHGVHCFSQIPEPLVYFRQDFCEPGTEFQSSSPGPGQVDHVFTSSSAFADLHDCYLEAGRVEPSSGGSVRILRTSPIVTPSPSSLHVVLEMEALDITQEGTIAAYFGIGQDLPTNTTLIANANLFSKLSIDFRNDGTYNFRISGNSGATLSDPLSGKITVTWVMNRNETTYAYLTPLKSEKVLAAGKYDIWINDHLWIDGANRISDVDLSNFAFILSNGVGKMRIHHLEISNNGFQLPLVLTRFKVERIVSEALVHWEMEPGHTALDFIIERSADGTRFEPIGKVEVTDENRHLTRFNYMDTAPLTGINYYRLKMIGTDGEVKYSPVGVLNFDPGEPSLTLAPNPAAPDRISLLTEGVSPGDLRLYSMAGTPISLREVYDAEKRTMTLYPASPLPSGIYLLRFQKDKVLKTLKVVIP